MVVDSIGKNLHIRIPPHQSAVLQRIAREEGCSVSDLVRRALIKTFSLPIDAPNGSEELRDVAIRENPDV